MVSNLTLGVTIQIIPVIYEIDDDQPASRSPR